MTDPLIKTELSRLDRNDLCAIAKRLEIKSYRHLTKARLIDLVLESGTPDEIRAVELISPHAKQPEMRRNERARRLLNFDSWNRLIGFLAALAVLIGTPFGILSYMYMRSSNRVVGNTSPVNETNSSNNPLSSGQKKESTVASPSEVAKATPSPDKQSAKPSLSRNNDPRAPVLLRRAWQLYNQRRFDSAISLCEQVLKTEPNNEEAMRLRNQIRHTRNVLNSNN
jgi:hypothetical protein